MPDTPMDLWLDRARPFSHTRLVSEPQRACDLELQLPEIRVAALSWGDPKAPAVVALHGWLDNAATFERLAPSLVNAGRRLVALDMPGHGHSEHRRQGPYHFIDTVADVIAATEALELERFSLLGHSMGAGICPLVAAMRPRAVERVALIEGLGPLVDKDENAAKRLASSIKSEGRKRASQKRVYDSSTDAAERLSEATGMTVDSATCLVARGLEKLEGGEGFAWRADPRLRIPSRLRMTEGQVLSFLRAVEAPTLLIQASDGWPYDADAMGRRIEAVPDIRVERLEGRHHLHLDDPGPVARRVADFLAP